MDRKKVFSVESYDEFLNRIFSFQKPEFSFGTERFVSSESVKSKVGYRGEFSRFIGDTVVFDLDDSQKSFIQEHYINPLYTVASDCLAEKLKEHTLHMTLHDLNATNHEDYDVIKRMFYTEIAIAQMINEGHFTSQSIKMETTCVFNMVNTSLVLGLKPKSQNDYDKLMSLYQSIERIYQLPYPFTPHITLAYYCRDGFAGNQIETLQKTINEMNNSSFDIELSTTRLHYQKFMSMNDYFNILRFV